MKLAWEHYIGLAGLVLMAAGNAIGLFWAPPEMMMGDVGRILYVHVPAAWICMVIYLVAFVGAVASLATARPGADALVESSVEVGVLLNVLLLVLGSIFAKPTWGVWWDWDPRLTASAIMCLTFVGVMVLRAMVDDVERRASWSAVTTVLAFVNIPVTYMSVRWWRSLHQVQSSSSTMSAEMWNVLWLNTVALLLVSIWFVARRYRIARDRADQLRAPPLEVAP
jgi:heme exporter protein C